MFLEKETACLLGMVSMICQNRPSFTTAVNSWSVGHSLTKALHLPVHHVQELTDSFCFSLVGEFFIFLDFRDRLACLCRFRELSGLHTRKQTKRENPVSVYLTFDLWLLVLESFKHLTKVWTPIRIHVMSRANRPVYDAVSQFTPVCGLDCDPLRAETHTFHRTVLWDQSAPSEPELHTIKMFGFSKHPFKHLVVFQWSP